MNLPRPIVILASKHGANAGEQPEATGDRNVKSTSLIVCISLVLSGTALAQQSTGVQGSASGNAAASASADRNGSNAGGSANGTAVGARDDASAGVAQGTELNATLTKPVDARKAKEGDEVTATLNEDIKSDGKVVAKKGSKLVGHVAAARPLGGTGGSTSSKGNSELAVVFDRAVLKDGREVPLNATVRALAAGESRASTGMDDAQAGLGAAGGAAGSMRSGGGGLVGGVAGGATGSLGGVASTAGSAVNSGATASAGALTRSSGAVGGLDATGRLASGSRGVFGLKGIDISSANDAQGSVLTSSTRNVSLDRGTRMLLVNGSASGSASGALSKGTSESTVGAASSAGGAARATSSPPRRPPLRRASLPTSGNHLFRAGQTGPREIDVE